MEVILPGSTRGIESEFIQAVYRGAIERERSALAINYLFHEKLAKKGFGEEVTEEANSLEAALEFCRADGYKKIRIIGKSLGGVVAGEFLKSLSKGEQGKFELAILGYDLGWINIKDFTGKILIIQGSDDPFGGIDLVKKDMEGAASTEVEYKEIKGADHGFRDPKSAKPVYVPEVINHLYNQKDKQ